MYTKVSYYQSLLLPDDVYVKYIILRISLQSQHSETVCLIGDGKHDSETRDSYV